MEKYNTKVRYYQTIVQGQDYNLQRYFNHKLSQAYRASKDVSNNRTLKKDEERVTSDKQHEETQHRSLIKKQAAQSPKQYYKNIMVCWFTYITFENELINTFISKTRKSGKLASPMQKYSGEHKPFYKSYEAKRNAGLKSPMKKYQGWVSSHDNTSLSQH